MLPQMLMLGCHQTIWESASVVIHWVLCVVERHLDQKAHCYMLNPFPFLCVLLQFYKCKYPTIFLCCFCCSGRQYPFYFFSYFFRFRFGFSFFRCLKTLRFFFLFVIKIAFFFLSLFWTSYMPCCYRWCWPLIQQTYVATWFYVHVFEYVAQKTHPFNAGYLFSPQNECCFYYFVLFFAAAFYPTKFHPLSVCQGTLVLLTVHNGAKWHSENHGLIVE